MIPGTPYVTAEVRWFIAGPVPDEVVRWICGTPAQRCDAEKRSDIYLRPSSVQAANVKLREGGVEIKQLQASQDEVLRVSETLRLPARLETWAKWRFASADASGDSQDAQGVATGWVRVEKQRYQRHFTDSGQVVLRGDLAASASLEVSAVRVRDHSAWSLCIEASGPDDDARRGALLAAARDLATLPTVAWRALSPANEASYPAWLHRFA